METASDTRATLGLAPLAVLAFVALATAQVAVSGRSDLPVLVGDRSVAIFDLWSLQHFCGGVLTGAVLARLAGRRLYAERVFAAAAFLLALAWEAAELAMEAGLFGPAVAHWKGSFEHWGNRLVGDPLMVTSGALLSRRFPRAWLVVILPAAIWLALNVTSPNSMSIQRLIFGLPDTA